MRNKQISLAIVSVLAVALTAGSFVRADEIYSGGVTIDINRDVEGYLWIEDATVNLLKNAHIKNAEYYGDVFAASGCILNIYGGQIDSYLYVTTSYNGLPEAQVAVYGYGFAVNGVPVAQNTPEVFLQGQQLSGFYQDGTPFSHWVDCFVEGNFYLTVKLGWLTSKPDMTAMPQSLDFGRVKLGSSSAMTVSIANGGNANLSLQSVSLVQDSNPGFGYTPLPQLPLTVEPGKTVSVEVVFSPAAVGDALGVLRITGDDADTPVIEVVLTGIGVKPDIAIEPASVDFGQMDIGASATASIAIANHGDAQLIVQSLNWAQDSSADFAIADMPQLPLTVEPNSVIEVKIVYTPTVEGAAAAVLAIQIDDPEKPLVNLVVTGTALNSVVSPTEQIDSIIAFYDESVGNGTIQGVGPGHSSQAHVKALRNALLCTKFLIQGGYERYAIMALVEIEKLTDGKPRPNDFITGSAVAELNAKIDTLITTLRTE